MAQCTNFLELLALRLVPYFLGPVCMVVQTPGYMGGESIRHASHFLPPCSLVFSLNIMWHSACTTTKLRRSIAQFKFDFIVLVFFFLPQTVSKALSSSCVCVCLCVCKLTYRLTCNWSKIFSAVNRLAVRW